MYRYFNLKEYYCDFIGGTFVIVSKQVFCEAGCESERCLEEEELIITEIEEENETEIEEVDGENETEKIIDSGGDGDKEDNCEVLVEDDLEFIKYSGKIYTDYCSSENLLFEYSCSNNELKINQVDCEDGCENGICLKKASTSCEGCNFQNNCYPIGFRKKTTFCNNEGAFVSQEDDLSNCKKSFECKSNSCIEDKCYKRSIFEKIERWFKRLFH